MFSRTLACVSPAAEIHPGGRQFCVHRRHGRRAGVEEPRGPSKIGRVSGGYAYDHAWTEERLRLAGLESALDDGTRAHLQRLGVGPGRRCIEIGAGGGAMALWLAGRVAPDGKVIATDLETDFLQADAAAYPTLEVLRHDITVEDLPTGFDLVHARWLTEWLPDKRQALRRMVGALRPGGVLLDEEPDFVTVYEAAEPPALRRVVRQAMRYLEATCPVDCQYGRRLLDDLTAVGLIDTGAEGRCPVVRGGSPPAAHFLRLTLDKLKPALFADRAVTVAEYAEAVAALEDPARTIIMPMTIAAWGRRP
jgi:SAM-dependent methyltransferase